MPFRAKYLELFKKAEWPPTSESCTNIYNQVARSITPFSTASKKVIFNTLEAELKMFDASFSIFLASQSSFDTWHKQIIDNITSLAFPWKGRNKKSYSTLTLGIAQKLLNLGLKDWWALAPNSLHGGANLAYLHAPLDRIVYTEVARFDEPLPSLKGKYGMVSYLYNLTSFDYLAYQGQLNILASDLTTALALQKPMHRIEIDQLLWGWV